MAFEARLLTRILELFPLHHKTIKKHFIFFAILNSWKHFYLRNAWNLGKRFEFKCCVIVYLVNNVRNKESTKCGIKKHKARRRNVPPWFVVLLLVTTRTNVLFNSNFFIEWAYLFLLLKECFPYIISLLRLLFSFISFIVSARFLCYAPTVHSAPCRLPGM